MNYLNLSSMISLPFEKKLPFFILKKKILYSVIKNTVACHTVAIRAMAVFQHFTLHQNVQFPPLLFPVLPSTYTLAHSLSPW